MLLQIEDPYLETETTAKSPAIGIDLGTTNSVVAYVKDGKPVTIVIEEKKLMPSVVCVKNNESSDIVFHSTKRLMATPMQSLLSTSETPLTIAAMLLKSLKEGAAKSLNLTTITNAVITVPAHFDDTARQATKKAAQMAGINVLRLIAEPTAAALAYGLEKNAQGFYAVFDLGGGTFDFSILQLQTGIFQVLATGGDTFLGGDDIDEAICQHCQINDRILARQLKESLGHTNNPLNAYDIGKIAQPFITKALEVCRAVLHDAQLQTSDLDGVILVGGSTRLLCVKEAVASFFNQIPLTDINPDEVVAHGAALHAEALMKGSDRLLLDVVPLSLGIETLGGVIERILVRNTPLPCSMAQEFTTAIDNQENLSIHILQGESDAVAECHSLGQFVLHNIPPMPAHTPRIRVTFSMDVNGLLTVRATEQNTGQEQTLEIQSSF